MLRLAGADPEEVEVWVTYRKKRARVWGDRRAKRYPMAQGLLKVTYHVGASGKLPSAAATATAELIPQIPQTTSLPRLSSSTEVAEVNGAIGVENIPITMDIDELKSMLHALLPSTAPVCETGCISRCARSTYKSSG